MGAKDSLGLAGRLGLFDPTRLVATVGALARWGPTVATLYRTAAMRYPNRPAVIDNRGTLRFAELDRRSTAFARGLLASDFRSGQQLGLLCRNHRDFVIANIAAAKAGLNVVYLNTGFGAPQLAQVLERERVGGLVCDQTFHSTVEASGFDGPAVIAAGKVDGWRSMGDIHRLGRRRPTYLRPRQSRPVLLTSGTTGVPQGAQRTSTSMDPRGAAGILQCVPYRQGDVFVISSPLFHAWGLSQLLVAAALGSTVIVSPVFSPEETVRTVIEHRATVLSVVPVLLQRMLANTEHDPAHMSSLRIVASSGSALPAPVAEKWMDRVGDTLYNLYGSTEVGQATIATPDDLRAAPGTAGRIVPGSEVLILDAEGNEMPAGSEGRIFVGNGAQFSGYTGGGTKEVIGGLMSSGDVGHFDADGRLFVTGRSDDMIISGGENVFPGEVEDILLTHPAVLEAAVVGVEDDEFGQRLAAHVVVISGSHLDEKAAKSLIAERLARHKVPRDVTFVSELPRTTTGKLLRRQLAVHDE